MPADPLVGLRVGSFVIEERLGAGGMGSVYRGVQPEIGKRVAIKFLADEFNANPNVVARFFQEAKAVNVIGHENIVDIFDFGRTAEGRNYFVMELLEAPSLERVLDDEKALATSRTVDIARQVASALTAAHSRGIVHRDLKPENVFLIRRAGRTDFVKLLDFGIAKLSARSDGEGGIGRTQSGMILGTPGYMAPEQAGGGTVDHRADIYALGVLLYRMLAGHIPFEGQTFAQIFRRQLMEEAKPLSTVRADVTAPLEQLVLEMLAREPVDRPPSMAEVEGRLGRIAEGTLSPTVVWYVGAPREPTGEIVDATGPTQLGTVPSPIAGETRKLRRSRGRGGLLAGAAMLCAAAAIGVTFVARQRTVDPAPTPSPPSLLPTTTAAPPPQQPSPPPVVRAAPPAIAPSVASPKPPVEAPGPRVVRVESEPPGAGVFEPGTHRRLGTTPAEVTLERPGPILVRLSGYHEERIEVRADDKQVRAVLHRARSTSGARLPGMPPSHSNGIGLDD